MSKGLYVRYRTKVPQHTEARIQQLCREAVAARTEADLERILPELRSALHEHICLAKDSLGGQASTISTLDSVAGISSARKVA